MDAVTAHAVRETTRSCMKHGNESGGNNKNLRAQRQMRKKNRKKRARKKASVRGTSGPAPADVTCAGGFPFLFFARVVSAF